MSYFHVNIRDLHFPLMALIHYRGCCLIASALLPIDSTTLRYGSSNAGETVHADDHELNQLMKVAAHRLKLQERPVFLKARR